MEYELCKENPTSPLLITDSFPIQNSAHTPANYSAITSKFEDNLNSIIEEYRVILGIDNLTENRILESISKCTWGDEIEKKKALIAAIYYKIISNAKGQHAFFLEQKLRDNFIKEGDAKFEFNVPTYITNAIIEIVKKNA